jgi:hypothetical protein
MSLKLLVNNKDIWEAFLEEIEERVEFAHRQLEQASTMEDMFRLQGEVRALRKLYKLRDKVNG